MTKDLRSKLQIEKKRLDELNHFLIEKDNKSINDFLRIVEKYGTPEQINKKAREAGKLDNLMLRLKKKNFSYYTELKWLIEQRDKGAFITIDEYRKNILGKKTEKMNFNEDFAVILEISACQYFSCFMAQVRRALEKKRTDAWSIYKS